MEKESSISLGWTIILLTLFLQNNKSILQHSESFYENSMLQKNGKPKKIYGDQKRITLFANECVRDEGWLPKRLYEGGGG